MERVNAQFFYRMAIGLHPIETIAPEKPISDQFSLLWTAQSELWAYLVNKIMPPVACEKSGWALWGALKELTDNFSRPEPISYYEASNIVSLLTKFENNLEAEYATKDLFVVSPKGLYSTTDLIERTENAFPEEFRDRIPAAMRDLKEAGRCIAFEVPTAAAFHIFRAGETVAKQYVAAVRGTPPSDKEKRGGLGKFVEILEEKGADTRVTSAISQLAKLHRNPTMHPEMFITKTEILGTFAMAQSVIQSMIADMELRRPQPSPAITSVLPDPKDLEYEREAENDGDSIQPLQLGDGGNTRSA